MAHGRPKWPEEFRLYAPWERTVGRLLTPIEEFIQSQTASAAALLIVTCLSLALANSPLGESYHRFFSQKLTLGFGDHELSLSLHHWINDGLMAFFFFLIGLEIKREVLIGELSDLKAALLPVVAAVGGMVLPALFYALVNRGEPTLNGWGIPMATDIAFAISVLMLLRRHVPPALVTFLVALAIVDDLGAVVVIALFYTSSINFEALAGAALVWGLLWVFNLAGIYRSLPYFLGGVLMWALMLASGVHATIAGVLTAFTVPTRPKVVPRYFRRLLEDFLEEAEDPAASAHPVPSGAQRRVLQSIHTLVRDVQPPSLRMEHALHLPVALLVIPLFALANAGVHLSGEALRGVFTHPVSLGIMLGLVLGKALGVAGTALLAHGLGLAPLPTGARPVQLVGVGFLAGIGFTMCIFIAELAWPGEEALLQQAKMSILLASLLSGVAGYLWLRLFSRR